MHEIQPPSGRNVWCANVHEASDVASSDVVMNYNCQRGGENVDYKGVDLPRWHDYDIHQRVHRSCAFPRSGASIGLKFRAYLVARAEVRAARAELDIP
jgi:hypothetical protein